MSARRGWVNDPNGLVHHAGVWHAFYQHVPHADVPGEVHWGHATSTDLVTWEDQPVALWPSELGMPFSGSVVIDAENTAGFGAGALVAMFTHHLPARECQSIAVSTDGAQTWHEIDGNPVLVSDLPDFRDPKVWRDDRHDDRGASWMMCLAAGRDVMFYRSKDLRRWLPTGRWTLPPQVPGTVECPDVLRVADPHGEQHDVLMFSATRADGAGTTNAVLGTFDGSRFVHREQPQLLDVGPDFYAAQSFHPRSPHPILMAWLGNWRTAPNQPSSGRRGALSFPRLVSVRTSDGGRRVTQRFAVEPWNRTPPNSEAQLASETDSAFHARLRSEGKLVLGGPSGPVAQVATDGVSLRFWRDDPIDGPLEIERRLEEQGAEILVDHGCIEILADGGAISLSSLFFAGPDWTVEVSQGGSLTRVRRQKYLTGLSAR